jgi:hypothetical protein
VKVGAIRFAESTIQHTTIGSLIGAGGIAAGHGEAVAAF